MSDTIRQLAEHVYNNVRNCSCDDDCVASIENTLRTLAPTIPIGREELGKLVREVWVECAKTLPNPKPHHLIPWEELDDWNKEVDRKIGERIATSLASSLQEKKCVWKWDEARQRYQTGCGQWERPPNGYGISQLGWKFCPLCQSPIEESKA